MLAEPEPIGKTAIGPYRDPLPVLAVETGQHLTKATAQRLATLPMARLDEA